jgi:hypothetical protein
LYYNSPTVLRLARPCASTSYPSAVAASPWCRVGGGYTGGYTMGKRSELEVEEEEEEEEEDEEEEGEEVKIVDTDKEEEEVEEKTQRRNTFTMLDDS